MATRVLVGPLTMRTSRVLCLLARLSSDQGARMTEDFPTRQEIAAILAGAEDTPQESDYYFADQVLARLRPAWDALEKSNLTWFNESKKAYATCDALRADLRACAKALEDARASWAGKDGRDLDGLCARCGRAEEQGCNQICAYGKARAALARPGVKEALRSEPKATAP